MSPIRKTAGLRSKYRPRPPATPAKIRGDFVRSRRLTWGMCVLCVVMSMRLPAGGAGGYPASPWSDPQRYSRLSMAEKLIAENRRARFDYDLLERVEAGIVLTGTEVKSLRGGRTTVPQPSADTRDGEAWLNGLEISIYDQGGRANHEPVLPRQLLLHRRASKPPRGQNRRK